VAPSSRHILVVDDEPHIGLLLRPHLEKLGYRVSLARTLADARAVLASPAAPVDGLLLDLHLPDGSGFDLLRELRATPEHRALPVLVLTGEGEDRILSAARELDATLLTKPFSPTKLMARIAALLGDPPPPPAPPPLRPPGYAP
jgi:two-component system, OmpR family, catabolic regulation response regulator CreB